MGMDEAERDRLTELFKQRLADYELGWEMHILESEERRIKRKYTKRPTGSELERLNRQHDANCNAWIKLALRYGE